MLDLPGSEMSRDRLSGNLPGLQGLLTRFRAISPEIVVSSGVRSNHPG